MFHFFIDLLYNEGVNKATTCKSYGPLTQKLMAVCLTQSVIVLYIIFLCPLSPLTIRRSLIHLVVVN